MRPSGCQSSRLVRADCKVQCLGSLSGARPTSQRVWSCFRTIQRVCCNQAVYISGFSVQHSDLGPLVFEGYHASTKALQWFSPDRATCAVSDGPSTSPRGERSTGPTPQQHRLGDAGNCVFQLYCSLAFPASVGYPVSEESPRLWVGFCYYSHGSTCMLAKCWVRSW